MYRAILLDKDGTLTDFRATWETWTLDWLADLSSQTKIPVHDLADPLGVDMAAGRFQPHGPIVTAPFDRNLRVLSDVTGWTLAALREWLGARPPVRPVPVCDTAQLLAGLRARGFRLGVLTNDSRHSALRDLHEIQAVDHLDHVVACDDGHGAKPDPAGALAFSAQSGVDPSDILMVGDGASDQRAAVGAGMDFAAVLTGTLGATDYPGARVVLPDVSHLPSWLDSLR